MSEKTCKICAQTKPLSEFRRVRGGASHGYCVPCDREYQRRWRSTPRARARAAWKLMTERAGNANGRNPAYVGVEVRVSRAEFVQWALTKFEQFAVANPKARPSVDRIDSTGHYELGNMQIISLSDNVRRARSPENCVAPTGMAWCKGCETYLTKSSFYADKRSKAGVRSQCKECYNARYNRV